MHIESLEELKEFIYNRHDTYCNQKYGDNLPYSFHLKTVEAQGNKFLHLIGNSVIINKENIHSHHVNLKDAVKLALSGHDLLEDSRMSYNDIKELASKLGNTVAGEEVANIIFMVTDEKGKTRSERKSNKYYYELGSNKLAVFVKLSDIAANTLYSKLTNSSMYNKYKEEFPKFKEKCYIEEFKEFFDYVEGL